MATEEEKAIILLKDIKQNSITQIQIGYALCERLDTLILYLSAGFALIILVELLIFIGGRQ